MQDFTTVKMFGTGQITIPKKYRSDADVKDFIVFKRGENIILKPIKINLEDLDFEEKGWKTILDLREEGGMDIGKLSRSLKSEIKRKTKTGSAHGQD